MSSQTWLAIAALTLGACVDGAPEPTDESLEQALTTPNGTVVGVAGQTYVVAGDAAFRIHDPLELAAFLGSSSIVQVGSLAGFRAIPADGTVLRERSAQQSYVMIAGARYLVDASITTAPTLVPDGALDTVPAVPQSGQLVRERSSAPVYLA